ncbi:MAG TPA: dynamin family protein [Mycobacteriales bacterium]|nr:dynamin family protein [Mycobacteriales bacterium]
MTPPESRGQHTQLAQLVQQAREATDAAVEVLRETAPDGVAEIERVRGRADPVPAVVVVGATKSGKSSLVNALLAAPELAPVDADVATSVFLRFQHGVAPAARAFLPGAGPPAPIPVGSLRDWATGLGSRPADQPPPRLIEVDHPAPLLTDLVLIDTPGVGGLVAASGEIALAAVREATALLFVVDAAAPFTQPELDFLRAASESVELVLFALAKIDAHRGWRQVLADDQALLGRHVPRFARAPFHPVSATLFARAAGAPSAGLAALLRTESQVVGLQLALQTTVAAQAAALREANTLRAARSQLVRLGRMLLADRAAIDTDPGRAEELRASRDGLVQARRAGGRTWQVMLRAEIQRARLESVMDVQREVRDQIQLWRAEIDRSDRARLARLPAELDTVVRALSLRQLGLLLGRLRRVTDNVLRELFAPPELAEIYDGFAHAAALRPEVAGPGQRQQNAEDRVVAMGGALAGLGASRLVTFLPAVTGMGAATMVALPVSVALGLAASAWLIRSRRHVADKQHYRQWVVETLTETRMTLESEISAQLVDAEQALTLALDEAIDRRVESLDREIRQIDDALRLDATAKDRRTRELNQRLASATAAAQQVDAVLARLRAGGGGGVGSVAVLASIAAVALSADWPVR